MTEGKSPECRTIAKLERENEQLRQTVQALRQAVSILTDAAAQSTAAHLRATAAQLRAGELVSDALGIWTQPAVPNN